MNKSHNATTSSKSIIEASFNIGKDNRKFQNNAIKDSFKLNEKRTTKMKADTKENSSLASTTKEMKPMATTAGKKARSASKEPEKQPIKKRVKSARGAAENSDQEEEKAAHPQAIKFGYNFPIPLFNINVYIKFIDHLIFGKNRKEMIMQPIHPSVGILKFCI